MDLPSAPPARSPIRPRPSGPRTEGDSFIVAFASPACATAFAAACQLALLEADWPQELLDHPDGAMVLVDPRDSGAATAGQGPPAAAAPTAVPSAATATGYFSAISLATWPRQWQGVGMSRTASGQGTAPASTQQPLYGSRTAMLGMPYNGPSSGSGAGVGAGRGGGAAAAATAGGGGSQSRRCRSSSQVPFSLYLAGSVPPPARPSLDSAVAQEIPLGVRTVSFSGEGGAPAPAMYGSVETGVGLAAVTTAAAAELPPPPPPPPPPPSLPLPRLASARAVAALAGEVSFSRRDQPQTHSGMVTCVEERASVVGGELQVSAPGSASATALANGAAAAARGACGRGGKAAPPSPPSFLDDPARPNFQSSPLLEAVTAAAAGSVSRARLRLEGLPQHQHQHQLRGQQIDLFDTDNQLVSTGLGSFITNTNSNQMEESISDAGTWCTWQELLAASFTLVPVAAAAAAATAGEVAAAAAVARERARARGAANQARTGVGVGMGGVKHNW
jgi:hypothetical protein